MKNCLTFDDMYYYLTENKIATETLDRFSNITSHLLRCNKCAKKVADAMTVIDAIDDWTIMSEQREREKSEILEVLINLEKAKLTASESIKDKISVWMKKISATSVKLSLNIKDVCEIVVDEAASVLNSGKYKFGYATPAYSGVFRDDNTEKDKTMVIDKKNAFNSIKILNNGTIEVSINVDDRIDAPMVLLMPKTDGVAPIIQIMKKDTQNDCWHTVFENVYQGEYSLLIE